MASTYVNDLRLNELGTGDGSGTWGTTTNTNLELIAEGLSFGTEGITTNADTHTSTIADGSTDPVRSMFVKYTGTLDSACTITIAPNTISRVHFIENGTSGSQNIIIKQGSGATITIPPGDVKCVYLDGAGSGAAVVDAFASLSVVDLKVQDDILLSSDSSVISMGADADVTITHDGTTGVTIAATPISIDSTGELHLNSTTGDIKLQDGGTDQIIFDLDGTDGAVIVKPAVDSDDIIFQQYDGTAVMTVEDNVSLAINNDITVAGRASGHVTTDNDGSFDLAVGNDFKCTPSGDFTLTFTNPAAGQSGNVILINSGGHTVSAHASVAINADTLTALSTAGTYALAYYCSAASGDNTITVAATGALT